MDEFTRRELIGRYRDGYGEVMRALDGSTRARSRGRRPSKWTAREIVHHLADSEMTSAIRLRRLIAEEGPLILGYDQEEFARRLFYDRPIEASLDAFRAARGSPAEILERLTTPSNGSAHGTHIGARRLRCERWLRDLRGPRAQPRRPDPSRARRPAKTP